MDEITSVFGRRLRRLRKSKGLTQEQLGQRAGIDYKHLGGIERGEHSPSFDAVGKIASALEVPFQQLFMSENSSVGVLEDNLELITRDIDSLDKAQIRRFLNDLLVAVRRLREN